MRRQALLAGAVSAIAATTLSGCIAAAVPLAAGAALVRTRLDGPATAAPKDARRAGAIMTEVPAANAEPSVSLTNLTALPAPDAAPAPGQEGTWGGLRGFVAAQAKLPPGDPARTSAVLNDAYTLKPARRACGALPPAILIDLDPGRGTFDPLNPGLADTGLAGTLRELRDMGIAVVWFSRLGENFGESVRAALVSGRLDPSGQDELVLMSDIGERKQTRRDAITQRLCPIAILGDERADFDELYLYLRNPEAALALDAMIGRGWFLASPFVTGPDLARNTRP